MAYSNVPIFPQTVRNSVYQITNGNGTTIETIFTGATNGTKIESIIVTSTDTSPRDISLYFTISATNYYLTTISIPATAGSIDSVPCVNILGNIQFPGLARDPNGNPYLYITSTTTLSVNAPVTITSGKFINIICSGGDF